MTYKVKFRESRENSILHIHYLDRYASTKLTVLVLLFN